MPSLTVTVMAAVPNWLLAGVTVTVRAALLPPKTMLPSGTSGVFDDRPERTRLAGAVSGSFTESGSAPSERSGKSSDWRSAGSSGWRRGALPGTR